MEGIAKHSIAIFSIEIHSISILSITLHWQQVPRRTMADHSTPIPYNQLVVKQSRYMSVEQQTPNGNLLPPKPARVQLHRQVYASTWNASVFE